MFFLGLSIRPAGVGLVGRPLHLLAVVAGCSCCTPPSEEASQAASSQAASRQPASRQADPLVSGAGARPANVESDRTASPFANPAEVVLESSSDPERAEVVQLIRHAFDVASSGDSQSAAQAWGLAVRHVADADTSSQTVVYEAAGRFFSEAGSDDVNGLRVAHELLRRGDPNGLNRFRTSRVEDLAHADVSATGQFELRFLDQHPAGTAVSLDGEQLCRVPCLLAWPLDGRDHVLELETAGGRATDSQ